MAPVRPLPYRVLTSRPPGTATFPTGFASSLVRDRFLTALRAINVRLRHEATQAAPIYSGSPASLSASRKGSATEGSMSKEAI